MGKVMRMLLINSLKNRYVSFIVLVVLPVSFFPLPRWQEITTNPIIRIVFANPANGVDLLCTLLSHYAFVKTGKEAYVRYASNVPLPVLQLVTKVARERGFTQKITCVQEEETLVFRVNAGTSTIFINPQEVQQLNELLELIAHNQSLTPEQETLYYHYIATIHHELNHIQRKTHLFRLLIPFIVRHYYFMKINNVWHEWGGFLKHATVFVVYRISDYFCAKYDEFMAETGIPDDKKLLEAQLVLHMKNREALQSMIDDAQQMGKDVSPEHRTWISRALTFIFQRKWFDRWPLLYEMFVFPHPSAFIFIPHVQERLKRIAKKERARAVSEKSGTP